MGLGISWQACSGIQRIVGSGYPKLIQGLIVLGKPIKRQAEVVPGDGIERREQLFVAADYVPNTPDRGSLRRQLQRLAARHDQLAATVDPQPYDEVARSPARGARAHEG